MCDIIEIDSRHGESPIFYPAKSTAFAVDIKGRGNVTIGLTSHARDTDDYDYYNPQQRIHQLLQINMIDSTDDDDNRSSMIEIYFNGELRRRDDVPKILDDDYYRSFWLSWYSGEIRFGRKGETTPMFTHGLRELKLVKYITFSNNDQNEVRWRFQLPPVIEIPRTIRTISGDKPTWKRGVPSRLPNNMIIGGFENEPLYIIRAFHNGKLCMGKFVPSERSAFVYDLAGKSHKKQAFDVLCGFNYQWVPTKNNRIPANAVKGGYIEDDHKVFYIGRARHDGHLIPGKVLYGRKCIYFAYKEEEIEKEDYEVLTEPKEEIYYINKPSNKGCDQGHGDEEESDQDNFERLREYDRVQQARRGRRWSDGELSSCNSSLPLFDEDRHVSGEQDESDEDHKIQDKTERFQAKSIQYLFLEIINKIIWFLFKII